MTPRTGARPRPPDPTDCVFYERRRLSGWSAIRLALGPVVAGWIHVTDPFEGWSVPVVFGVGWVVVMGSLFRFVPGSHEWRHVAVHHTGLWVGTRHLDVDRIARAEAVEPHEARRSVSRFHHRGTMLAPVGSSYGRVDDDPAVAVYVTRSGSDRVWLVKTSDPDGLVAALDAVRPEPEWCSSR